VGPGWCVLCWASEEMVQNLFIRFTCAQKVCSVVCGELKLGEVVFYGYLNTWIIGWLTDNHDSQYRYLPLFLVYFVWWARNSFIFQTWMILGAKFLSWANFPWFFPKLFYLKHCHTFIQTI
jgi:hypothetical protein